MWEKVSVGKGQCGRKGKVAFIPLERKGVAMPAVQLKLGIWRTATLRSPRYFTFVHHVLRNCLVTAR
jgi:hypothetical protein